MKKVRKMELLDKHEIETGNKELLGQKNCTTLAHGLSGARPACQREAFFLLLEHLPSNYIISILFYGPTMKQIPLRVSEDGTISLHPLGTSDPLG